MRCSGVQRELSAFMDGELGLEQSQAVADHLAECGSCADDFRSLRQLVHWASMVPEVDPPAHFPARILAAALAAGTAAPARPAWSLARAVRELRVPPQFLWAACACATAAVALAFASTHPSLPRVHQDSRTELAMVAPKAVVTTPPVVITPITPPSARPAPVPAPPPVHIETDLPPAEAATDTERSEPIHATPPVRMTSIQTGKPVTAPRAESPAPRIDTPPITTTNTTPPATQPKSADPSNPPGTSDMMAAAAMPTTSGMDSSSGTMGMATEKVAPAAGDKPPVLDEEVTDLQKFLDERKQKSQPGSAPQPDGTGARRPM